MLNKTAKRWVPLVAAAAIGVGAEARGDILYSTIAGSTAAGSTQPAYSSSLTLTETVTGGGPVGFGDDYTVGYNGTATTNQYGQSGTFVQASSLSFYGDVEPLAGGTTDPISGLSSLGGTVSVNFFFSNGSRDIGAVDINPTPSSVQGPGLHTITFGSPILIPATGYVLLEPELAATFNGATGFGTPLGTVPASFTGDFGSAPTIGKSAAGTFATVSAAYLGDDGTIANSTYASVTTSPTTTDADGDTYVYTPLLPGSVSSGYLQLEIDGTGSGGLVPEPASMALIGVSACGILARRRRS